MLRESDEENKRSNRTSNHTTRETSSTRGREKRDASLKDQQSTGRKRAARQYPLDRNAPCEWQNKSNCGGGLYPILGCISGKQQARHHGPDKSVSNNAEGNVHRICHYCHNRWHAANDPSYDWNSTVFNQHEPVTMTTKEQASVLLDELRYNATKSKKVVKD